MTRTEFTKWLDSIGAIYSYTDNNGKLEQVYVFEKGAYEKKKKHPRKYNDLYVDYLRVSNFDGKLYTRRSGLCMYMSDNKVKEICIQLTRA